MLFERYKKCAQINEWLIETTKKKNTNINVKLHEYFKGKAVLDDL